MTFALISLAALSFATAGGVRAVDLPLGVPVEVAIRGLDSAMADDSGVVGVEADVARGVLILTGTGFPHSTVVYAWTGEALPLVIAVRVVAPPPQPRRAPVLLAGMRTVTP